MTEAVPFRVVLVEDSPDDEKMTLRALKEAKVQDVFVARDGAEALDYLFSRNEFAGRVDAAPPMLVLLDLKLPKVSGIEVLEQIRANPATTNIPVVVLTSSDEDMDIIRTYDLRANSYVKKPVDYESFMSTVKGLGLYWTTTNLRPPR